MHFYTSVKLGNDLSRFGTPACGTITENRKGLPIEIKNGKNWAKSKERGSMRWIRNGNCLSLQWIDNKVVRIISTIDVANDYIDASRQVRINGSWERVDVKKPLVINRYNTCMNGVDKSDQLLAKCIRWWKTLFFHVIDIAVVNYFILFNEYRKQNPDKKHLQRSSRYSLLEFREVIIRNIMDLEEYGDPPAHVPPKATGISQLPIFWY